MLQRFYDYLLKNQVVFAIVIIFLAGFIFLIRNIILSLFLSYIIMAAVLPITMFLRKIKVPKTLAVLIPYFAIVLLLFILIIPLVPFVMGQLKSLILGFPNYLNQVINIFGFKVDSNIFKVILTVNQIQ